MRLVLEKFLEATFPAHINCCWSCFSSSTTYGVYRALLRMSTRGRRHLAIVSPDKVQTVAATLSHWGSSCVKGGLDQGPQAQGQDLALSRVTCVGQEGCPAPAKSPAQAKCSSGQEKIGQTISLPSGKTCSSFHEKTATQGITRVWTFTARITSAPTPCDSAHPPYEAALLEKTRLLVPQRYQPLVAPHFPNLSQTR